MGPISGADELLVTYATRLLGAGVNVSVLLMFSQNGDAYHDRLRRAGVPVTGIAEGTAVKAMRAGHPLPSARLRVLLRALHDGAAALRGGRGALARARGDVSCRGTAGQEGLRVARDGRRVSYAARGGRWRQRRLRLRGARGDFEGRDGVDGGVRTRAPKEQGRAPLRRVRGLKAGRDVQARLRVRCRPGLQTLRCVRRPGGSHGLPQPHRRARVAELHGGSASSRRWRKAYPSSRRPSAASPICSASTRGCSSPWAMWTNWQAR
jgi:hypothetical protein